MENLYGREPFWGKAQGKQADFMKQAIKQKIEELVDTGYIQGAFRELENADYFASLLIKKLYFVSFYKIIGPSVESMIDGKEDCIETYYVVGKK